MSMVLVVVCISCFLMVDEHRGVVINFCRGSYRSLFISVVSFSVLLYEVIGDPIDGVEGMGTQRVAGQLDTLPSGQVLEEGLPKLICLFPELLNLGSKDLIIHGQII